MENPVTARVGDQDNRLQLFFEIGRAVSSSLELSVLYETLFQQIARVIDTTVFFVALGDAAGETIHLPYMREDGVLFANQHLPARRSVTGLVMAESTPLCFARRDELRAFAAAHGYHEVVVGKRTAGPAQSFIFVPLKTGSRVIGALSVQTRHQDAYGADDVQVLTVIASQAAIAVENARLYAESQASVQRMQVLLRVAQVVGSSLDTQTVLESILAGLREVLPYHLAGVMLPRDEDTGLEAVSSLGSNPIERSVTTGEGVTDVVFRTGKPLIVPDVTTFPGYVSADAAVRSEMAIPLTVADRVVGVLTIQRVKTEAFSADDLHLGELFASQVAMAVEHAEHFAAQKVRMAEQARVEEAVRASEERFHYQALHDGLTGLPNRTMLIECLQRTICRSENQTETSSLLLLDLDRFKDINDTFGHGYGDLLLQQIGGRFAQLLGPGETVARLGGDEFAMLISGGSDRAQEVAMAVLAVLASPFPLFDHQFNIEASIGIALCPEHGASTEVLLRRADVAMYQAKRGSLGFALYSPERDDHTPERLDLIADLRHAIDNGELLLNYQPKINLHTREIEGVEALARWRHPQRGFIPPDQFIPLAEHTGLIKPLSIWVLDQALAQCRAWHDVGLQLHVAVNLSARNLHDQGLISVVESALARHRVDAHWLKMELTESVVMTDPTRAGETLARLRALGVKIAIDDFGTGYSSLGYLKHLPVDEIKIDRSFVRDMETSDNDRRIVQTTIQLGHGLKLQTVAEGVETLEASNLLTAMGCDVAQGYYLSQPLAADDCTRWLTDRYWRAVS